MSTALSPIRSIAARREHHRHRPLALVGVVADLQREAEALAVEVVDDVVLADEVARHFDVAVARTPAWTG